MGSPRARCNLKTFFYIILSNLELGTACSQYAVTPNAPHGMDENQALLVHTGLPAKRVGWEVHRGIISPQLCPKGRWQWYLTCLDNVHMFILYTWAHTQCQYVLFLVVVWCDAFTLVHCAADEQTRAWSTVHLPLCQLRGMWYSSQMGLSEAWYPFSYPGATWCFLHTQLQYCWPNSFRP